MHLAAHIAGLFHHVRRHGLFHILHALRFEPVDLADGLFLVGPSLVGIHANGFPGHAAHGFNSRLVGLQSHLHLQHRKVFRLARLLAGDLRRVNADGKIRDRCIRRVEAEKFVQRNIELLAQPIENSDIDSSHCGVLLFAQRLADVCKIFPVLPGIARGNVVRDGLNGLHGRGRKLLVAHDRCALAMTGNSVAPVFHLHSVAILAGRHGRRPGVAQHQALQAAFNFALFLGWPGLHSHHLRRQHRGHTRRACDFQHIPSICHRTLLAPTRSLVQGMSSRRLI